jgi:hypothetical protein
MEWNSSCRTADVFTPAKPEGTGANNVLRGFDQQSAIYRDHSIRVSIFNLPLHAISQLQLVIDLVGCTDSNSSAAKKEKKRLDQGTNKHNFDSRYKQLTPNTN